MAESKIKEAIDVLWKNPDTRNWEKFAAALKRSRIKYYRVFFQKGSKLRNVDDLMDSYVGLYESPSEQAYKVPLFKKDGKKVRGATIYLKGLLQNR